MICALLMPLNAPLWLPCAAGAFAVLIAKAPFGSFGRTPFNPAAAGVAFASLCWPELVFTFFDPAQPHSLPPFGACTFHAGESAAAVLKDGLKPDILPLDLLWGEAAGPLGTGAALVIAAGALSPVSEPFGSLGTDGLFSRRGGASRGAVPAHRMQSSDFREI